jgi:hypothetical protein
VHCRQSPHYVRWEEGSLLLWVPRETECRECPNLLQLWHARWRIAITSKLQRL